MENRRISPTPHPRGNGYIVNFRHPLRDGKPACFGLGTNDENTAKSICLDLRTLFQQPEILQGPPYSPKLLGYEYRAVVIAAGKEAADAVFGQHREKALGGDEIAHIGTTIELAQGKALVAAQKAKAAGEEVDPPYQAWRDEVGDKLRDFTPKAYRELQERAAELEKIVKVQSAELDSLRAENVRLRRQQNIDIKVTIQDAIDTWHKAAAEGRKSSTVRDWKKSLDSFIGSLPATGRTRLGAVDSGMIDTWIENLKGKDGARLAPITKRNKRNGLSVFFKWAVSKYKLVENPVAKTLQIPGVERTPEKIIAIRRAADLKEFLDSLKPWPYWRTWCAVAILAGPRFQEQCYIKLDDVYLDGDGDVIRITTRSSGRHIVGTKTGRERTIPIEKTTLKPILKAHIMERKKEQRLKTASDAQRSDWLFPTAVPDGTVAREKTPPGLWSSNRVFLNAWEAVAEAAWHRHLRPDPEAEPDGAWTYGPREWRHTFGTVLGNCGWGPLEISRVMGNSPDVCERHYVASASHGRDKRWPFRW